MGSPPYQISYQFPGQGEGLPFLVGPQYANFPQFSPTTYAGGAPTTPTAAPLTAPISIPVDDVYCPAMCTTLFGTPRSDGSTTAPLTEDPKFSTDEYEMSDMDPRETARRKGAKKKGNAPVGDTSDAKPKRPRSTYTPSESMMIVECWADTTED